MRLKFLIYTLALGTVVSALNFFALRFNLYWILPWFDVMMHFLGGFLIAMLVFLLFFFKRTEKQGFLVNDNYFLSFILLQVFVVGILWEVFELYFGITAVSKGDYLIDTFQDILFDLLGAFVFSFFARKSLSNDRMSKNEEN